MAADQSKNNPKNNGGDKTKEKGGHRFQPGNTFGTGRPKGSRNKVTIAALHFLDGEAEALTRKAIEKAMEGDVQMLRLCLERITPVRKDAPIEIKLPKVESEEDVVGAMGAVLNAVAEGEITPEEGQKLAAILEVNRRAIELEDHGKRLRELEALAKPKDATK